MKRQVDSMCVAQTISQIYFTTVLPFEKPHCTYTTLRVPNPVNQNRISCLTRVIVKKYKIFLCLVTSIWSIVLTTYLVVR